MATVPRMLGDIDGTQENTGNIAPLENTNPAPQPEPDLGPNNEQLEKVHPELVAALRQLVIEYRQEGIIARRHEIRRIRQARMFWQGLQYAWWDDQKGMYVVPFAGRLEDDKDDEEMPRYMYVTNIYLAFGLSFIAVISGDVPNVTTRPAHPSKIEDVTAAKAAEDVIDLIEENNKPKDMLTDTAYYLWTDGKIGAYVRYVADAQRFGSSDEPTLETGQMPLGDGSVSMPMAGASRSVPNGQEVIDIVGGLELNTPIWARKQHQFPYLQWQMEVHRAQLKATYPHVEDKIQMGGAESGDEVYARTSRIAVSQGIPSLVPGDSLYNLVTFSRTWIRPWAFFAIDDKDVREKLLALFPKGCYAAFAGDTYCESRNESMDDCWRVMHALPGEGQNRPSVGDPLIDVQQRYNTLNNIAMETYDYGLPYTVVDQEVMNADAVPNQTVEPGAMYFARPRAGQPLAAAFYQPPAAEVPESMAAYGENLAGEQAQFLTGLFPALFGGEMDTQKTATGYAQARDQAMGRVGLIWGRLKEFYAQVMMQGVRCFRENRADDVEMAVLGDDDDWESNILRAADLRGNFEVIPEGDENFPLLRSQQRSVLANLFSMFGEDPEFAKSASLPANQEFTKDVMGLPEWELPGADARLKQLRELKILLQSAPQQIASPGPNGLPQMQQKSTVPVGPLDYHEEEFEVCKGWASSSDGIAARTQNPAGFANVMAHAMEHQQAAQQGNSPQNKPPSESIGLKDLPPEGQVQMAAQAGIKLDLASMQAKEMQDKAEKAAQFQAKLQAGKQGPPAPQ